MEALREAFAHPSFWLLTAGFFVCGFHVAFIMVHLPAFTIDQGLPSWVGSDRAVGGRHRQHHRHLHRRPIRAASSRSGGA